MIGRRSVMGKGRGEGGWRQDLKDRFLQGELVFSWRLILGHKSSNLRLASKLQGLSRDTFQTSCKWQHWMLPWDNSATLGESTGPDRNEGTLSQASEESPRTERTVNRGRPKANRTNFDRIVALELWRAWHSNNISHFSC